MDFAGIRQARLAIVAMLIIALLGLAACGRTGSRRVQDATAVATESAAPATATATRPDTALSATPTHPTGASSNRAASPLPTATTPTSPLNSPPAISEPLYTYEVIAEYPFDPLSFTQGLVYTNSVLYVGTGLYGQSTLRKTDLESGKVLQNVSLDEEFFGEGVTVFDGKVYQLTWQEYEGFVYDEEDLERISAFDYMTEGWGLTHDGTQLIMSDGTPNLYFLDPETLEETGRVQVTSSLGPLPYINELEYIDGEIFANVWTTDWIARIDPATGTVLGWIDLTGLLAPDKRVEGHTNVLNGIAYDAERDRLFVTGKFWPLLFEISLVPKK